MEQGCWETGLTYECRTVLFKAFHNLIERSLLAKGFARFGKWFAQPQSSCRKRCISGPASPPAEPPAARTQLSFAFDFFVHGDSTVCASVDVRQHPAVSRLHKNLLTVAQGSQAGVEVILSPYGLAATLTGQTLKENDPAVQKFLSDWKKFYPLTLSSPSSASSSSPTSASSKDSSCSSSKQQQQLPMHMPFSDPHDDPGRAAPASNWCPAVVEVLVAGMRMRYPSSYCFYSPESLESQVQRKTSPSPASSGNNITSTTGATSGTASSSSSGTKELVQYIPPGRQPLDSLLTPPCSPPNPADPQIKLKTPVMSHHQPEKPTLTFALRTTTEVTIVTKEKLKCEHGDDHMALDQLWDFVDPAARVSCACVRSRSPKKNTIAKSGQVTGLGAKKEKERLRKNQIFHKRNVASAPWNATSSPASESADRSKQQAPNQGTNQAPSSVQPKTPSLSYKSPAPGGLPSLQSNATTPGCLDSPRSSQLMNGDGPESAGAMSVSSHPSKDQSDFQTDAAVAPSPAVNPVTKEKSQLEQLLSPYPSANSAKDLSSITDSSLSWSLHQSGDNHDSQDGGHIANPLQRPLLAACLDDGERAAGKNLLYDFSVFTSECSAWDLPQAKRRRNMPFQDEAGSCDARQVSRGGRDPYEFKDGLDEEQLFSNQESQEVILHPNSSASVGKSAELWNSNGIICASNNTTAAPPLTKEHRPLSNGLSSVFAPSPLTPNSQFMMNTGDLQASISDLDQMFDPSSGEDSADGAAFDGQGRSSQHKHQSSAPTDLSTMFPTPPSQENAAASPSTLALEATFQEDTVPCSPAFMERLRDSDIVYKPPITCKIIASRKYAQVPGIPGPFRVLPAECKYRMSNPTRSQHLQPSPHADSQLQSAPSFRPNGYSHQQSSPGSAFGMSGYSPRGPYTPMSLPPHGPYNRPLGPVKSPGSYAGQSPMAPSPLAGALQGTLAGALAGKAMYRTDVNAQMPPFGGPMARGPRPGHPLMNGMFDQVVGPEQGFRNPLSNGPAPEVNAVLVNLALSDSILNLHKDHNFESCTICVCNMDIKGSDAGIYIPESLMSGADEPQYKCTCGFSAVVNRRKSPFSGLFYEDEVEVTGLKYEPIERFNRIRSSSAADVTVASSAGLFGSLSGEISATSSLLLDLMRSQCSYILSQSSLLSQSLLTELAAGKRTLSRDRFAGTHAEKVSILRSDSSEVTLMALTSGKAALDSFPKSNACDNRLAALRKGCLHDWQFGDAEAPANNHDVVRFLRSLQPLLQESVQKKPKAAAMWEVTYSVSGPLTWRQFHKLASRTEDQCEPQPIPSLLVGQNREWVGVAPFALKMWEHLFFEPFSTPRDVAYLILTPDSSFILPRVKSYFRELTVAYESLRFGRHVPMNKILPDGIVKVNKSSAVKLADEKVEDQWFAEVADTPLGSRLKLYAQACTGYLVPLIRETSAAALLDLVREPKPVPSNPPPAASKAPSNSMGGGAPGSHPDAAASETKPEDSGTEGVINTSFSAQVPEEIEDESSRQPAIVVYIVDPFSAANLEPEAYRTACVGLLRCFAQVYKALPDHQNSLNLQIISLESILTPALDVNGSTRQEQMKSLALSVFGQCRKTISPAPLCKSLTGFGPSASLEQFLKRYTAQGLTPHSNRFFCPPFILAPLKDKQTELGEMFGERREKSMTLYCSYCLTEDQRWLVASCSNEKGDILDTTVINIEVPNRNRRKGATVRKFGLNKLMEFLVSVMSEALEPWRLVIGRVGRLGHGEMREWASLLSKKALLKATARLQEKCELCKDLKFFEVPSILSACLISLEPDTALRVFPDQTTTEDRFSNRSNTCPLTTPDDASSTHLLIFPTSATMSSSQGSFQNDPSNLGDDDLLGALGVSGCDDDLGVDDGMNDLFNWNEDLPSPGLQGSDQQGMSHSGSPGARQAGFDGNGFKVRLVSCFSVLCVTRFSPLPFQETNGVNDMSDEPLQLLQQPLALGYYVSTAPTGPLPRWFWSSCPHLHDVTPVFLKVRVACFGLRLILILPFCRPPF